MQSLHLWEKIFPPKTPEEFGLFSKKFSYLLNDSCDMRIYIYIYIYEGYTYK